MTNILTKRFIKLRKQLQFYQSELEYVREVLNEWHYRFDEEHKKFCEDNNIDLNKLNSENIESVDAIMSKVVQVKEIKIDFKSKKQNNQIKKIYKQLAKILHPDAGGSETDFKTITSAMSENNLEKLFDISEEHGILIEVNQELIELFEKKISEVKQEVEKEKSTYSWKLFSCDGNRKCTEKLFKVFLKQLFNYGG